jgi:hypothetical protein
MASMTQTERERDRQSEPEGTRRRRLPCDQSEGYYYVVIEYLVSFTVGVFIN